MGSISLDVDEQLLADLLRVQPLPGFLHFENGAMIFEKKVQPRPSAGIARRPFFATDVVEFQHEEGVHEILQIVLILDLKGGAAGMPRTKLTRDEVYS